MPENKGNPRPYRVKLSVDPATGERWALVEGPDGVAHYGTTLYGVACLRERGLTYNTQMNALGAVAIALNWAERRRVDLDARVGRCEFLDRGEAVDLRQALRRNGNLDKAVSDKARRAAKAVVSGATWATRIRDVHAYLAWHAQDVVRRIPNRDTARALDARARLEDFGRLMLNDLPRTKRGRRLSMGGDGRAAFLAAIRPDSPQNPFKPPYRRRNYLLMRLIDEIGCRRGEALGIAGEDLFLRGDRKSSHPYVVVGVFRGAKGEKADGRPRQPLPKTLKRPAPLSEELAADLFDYVRNERPAIPNSKRTPYLFLARSGKPLSLLAVNDMYRLLRARASGVPAHASPHVSRHDWNERFSDYAEAVGMSEAEEAQARNHQMGWVKNSTQGENYQLDRTERRANEAALGMQEKSWNGNVK